MNVERILAVADAIEKSETFDMSRYFKEWSQEAPCKTPGCIAGHADFMYSDPEHVGKHLYNDIGNPSSRAAEALGLDRFQATALFLDNWSSFEIKNSRFSAKQAAEKLRYLAEHGYVTEWIKGE